MTAMKERCKIMYAFRASACFQILSQVSVMDHDRDQWSHCCFVAMSQDVTAPTNPRAKLPHSKDDNQCVDAAEAFLNCVLKTGRADHKDCQAAHAALRACCAERNIVAIRLRNE